MSRRRKTPETLEEQLQRLKNKLREQLQPNSRPLFDHLMYLQWQEGYTDAEHDSQEWF